MNIYPFISHNDRIIILWYLDFIGVGTLAFEHNTQYNEYLYYQNLTTISIKIKKIEGIISLFGLLVSD